MSEAVVAVKHFKSELSTTDKVLISIVEQSQKIADAFNNVKGLKEFLALVEKYKSVSKEADDELERRKTIVSQLEKAEERLRFLYSEEAKELAKVRLESQEVTRSNKEHAKSALNLITPYQKFAKEVNDAKNRAKILGAEMVSLENRFKNGEIKSREYNKEISKLSKEYTEARLKAMGLDAQLKKIDASVGDNQRNVGNYKSAINGIAGSFKNLIAAFGVVSAIDMFADLTRKSFETIKVLNAQNAALKQVFETEAQVAFQKQYLSEITNKYGLELVKTTEDYTKFSAAVKGTYLEGEKGRQIFESFAGASSKLGLGAEQTSGIFKALEQMISKGKIQAEELRGQLGDRMAGAFKLFAQAMGISTAQLDKMLKDGEVLADDVLPKVAENLKSVYDLSGESDTLTAAQNRLTNSWTSFLDQIAGDKDLINSLADGLELLGDILGFVIDTLLIRGEDGVSVLGDLVDIIEILFSSLGDISEGLGLVDEKTKSSMFTMNAFKNDLENVKQIINVVAGAVKYLAETIGNFFGTMFQENGWDKFTQKMSDAADRFLGKIEQAKKIEEEIKKLNEDGKLYSEEKKKADEYQTAWNKARKEKQAYFQLNGKYFNTSTGRNTGKSVDDYIDRGDELIKKPKFDKTTITDDKASKDAEKAKKKAEMERKNAEREAEKARRLAYANAKAEIEAEKLSLDFLYKSFDQEKMLTDQKEVFYSYYYKRKHELLEADRDIQLKYAKTDGERQKILQKFQMNELDLEKEKQEKIKKMRVEDAESDLAYYKSKNESILDLGLQLTDGLIEIENKRQDEITKLNINLLEKKYELNADEVFKKEENNEKLTTLEQNFLTDIANLHLQNKKEKEKIDKEYNENFKKRLDETITESQKIRNSLFATGNIKNNEAKENSDYNEKISEDKVAYEKSVEYLLKNVTDADEMRKKLADLYNQYNKLQEDREKVHQDKLNDIQREGLDIRLQQIEDAATSSGKISDIMLAMDQIRAADKMKSERMAAIESIEIESERTEAINKLRYDLAAAYGEGLSTMIGGLKNFAKEGSAIWKGLSVFEATLNMFVGISEVLSKGLNPWQTAIQIALISSRGLMIISKINSTPNPKYKDGTLFAERSTTAITDEEGPELHFDKNWKLKDKGSSGGARFKNVQRGDKIIPADISKQLTSKDISKLIIMPQLPTIIDTSERIDYSKLSKMIAKETTEANEKQKKEYFLIDPSNNDIIRIESKAGMRVVHRKQPSKPIGQNFE